MEAGLGTPLLDFFRRGEAARDVRMLAARGAIAPRALEQLGILIVLSSDADSEIRETAEQTLRTLPVESIATFIARSDVPLEMREFFTRRGIEPAASSGDASDEPLVDAEAAPIEDPGDDEQTVTQRLAAMTVPEKVRAAIKGTREMRVQLIRDPNRMVAFAVLSCPKVSEQEVETFARMTNVSSDILRTIGQTRAWIKNYGVVAGLAKNPKTPVALSLNLLNRLMPREIRVISTDRNVPEPLRLAARRRMVEGER